MRKLLNAIKEFFNPTIQEPPVNGHLDHSLVESSDELPGELALYEGQLVEFANEPEPAPQDATLKNYVDSQRLSETLGVTPELQKQATEATKELIKANPGAFSKAEKELNDVVFADKAAVVYEVHVAKKAPKKKKKKATKKAKPKAKPKKKKKPVRKNG